MKGNTLRIFTYYFDKEWCDNMLYPKRGLVTDIDAKITINNIPISMDQIVQFAPIVYFCGDEPYKPCSIEYILSNSVLCDTDDPNFKIKHPTQKDLETHHQDNFYLNIDKECIHGPSSLNEAIMYVAVQVPYDEQYVDLRYIFLYAYNGPQTSTILESDINMFDCALSTYAEHQGDIEGITVRVTADFQQVISVNYESHGDDHFFDANEVDFEKTHPIVLSAYNSHASYNSKYICQKESYPSPNNSGLDDILLDKKSITAPLIGEVGINFVDIISPQEIKLIWKPFEYDHSGKTISNNHLVQVGLNENDDPLNEERWARFKGNLGAPMENSFTEAKEVAGREIPNFQKNLIKIVATYLEKYGMVPNEYKNTTGPVGLGRRPYIHIRPTSI